MATEGLVKGQITDESVALMRKRIGYPNPTLRVGVLDEPWNMSATADAIRRYSLCTGDDNPLYTRPDYASNSRWGETIAPPGFEKSMGINCSRTMSDSFEKETRKALRGVQLYYSGGENFYYAPIVEGDRLYKSRWVDKVEVKDSEFAGRSVIVTNGLSLWDEHDQVAVDGVDWFVHAERRKKTSKDKYAKDEPAWYSDEELAEIEAAYDAEFRRGSETLYLEDLEVGQVLPKMVKGPLTITDLINLHMGAGWLVYGNPPYRLAYENRKRLRGFYTRDEYNAWDTLQRVHWNRDLAQEVGVGNTYDIGAVRQLSLSHYCTNFAGDNAWVYRIRFELRRFNYMGDTTWIEGVVTDVRVDDELGPLVDINMTGTNQRGNVNVEGSATILVNSREHGDFRMPKSPELPRYRR
ncbi:MAG: hypothetical protein HOC23_09310 [Halieaceae bacterium]|jgi:acyl dehydratase|nr:hypothetical protein [Halieaceae bacterium]